MQAIIQTKGLTKVYGGMMRVRDVDLQVREGEIYGFLGPNGAGKSTTMKMILGLVKPSDGQVEVLGLPFTERNRIEILRSVGSLIESPAYYGHLTGRENMRVLQRLLDLPEQNVREAVRIVRMEGQMDKKVRAYSLGMKQRLGIAMAIARFPKLLMLDEPTNGLDPAGIEEIRELIRRLPQEYGMTVMISSHLLSEIDRMATAVGIIQHGELIFQDSMETLRQMRRPVTRIRTSDDALAARTLSVMGAAHGADGLSLEGATDEQAALAVKKMVEAGVDVYCVEQRMRSLEEVFLEMTGKEAAL
ncbi:ATP-binding cassette domain-containing protein [Beduinella massiliensis]|uniref:ATP-binding cassette domain-containing protein n=1 Tax=Beduinella massiliensis TaxID=1852363 RepID=UPI000C82222E